MIKKHEILALEEVLYEAMKTRNTDVLDSLLHEDLLFIVPGGKTITKEMDLNSYREGSLKLQELTSKIEELNIVDDMAILTLFIDLKGHYNGESFEAKYKYIRFWKKFPEGIKIVGGSGITI